MLSRSVANRHHHHPFFAPPFPIVFYHHYNEYVRTCAMIFHEILAYCEQEHLLPCEATVKTRFNTNTQGRGGSRMCFSITFADFMQTISQSCPTAVILGSAPERILYERMASGEIRRFPCADICKPQQRFSDAQMIQIYLSLQKKQSSPTWGGGRFGFACYFRKCGPEFLRDSPMGYLQELTQLLLNRSILHCTLRDKVSVNSKVLLWFITASATAPATALANESIAAPATGLANESAAALASANPTASAAWAQEFKDTKVHSLLHLLNLEQCIANFDKEHVDLSVLKEICQQQMADVLLELNVDVKDQPRLIQAVNLLGNLI